MSKQFKVGDQVVRTYDPHRLSPVGTKGEVVGVGDVRISVKLGDGSLLGWLKGNCKVVSLNKTPECKFVPGNTYKDEEGREYKFLLHVPEAKSPYERAVFINEYGAIVLRHEDGDHPTPRSRLDIIPNKETRTVSVYKTPGGGYACQWAPKPGSPLGAMPADWKLIGEVKEEVEVY